MTQNGTLHHMRILSLDRALIAVTDLGAARSRYESHLDIDLGDPIRSEVETIAGIQRSTISYGYPGIELIEPLKEDSALARYLRDNGPGLFGLVYRVDDIEATVNHLDARGIEPIAQADTEKVRERHYHPNEFSGVYTVFTEYHHPAFDQ